MVIRTALLVLMLGAAPAAADEISRCVLEVDGQSYLDGPCEFYDMGDGGFTLGTGTDSKPAEKYFAYFEFGPPAKGYWNGLEGGTHAQDPLGELTKDGACWSNAKAKICAYQ